jgi:hypothetical protein
MAGAAYRDELVIAGRKTEAKAADIFVVENVEVADVAHEPKKISLSVEFASINALIHHFGKFAGEVFGLVIFPNNDTRQAIERMIGDLKWRGRSHSEPYLAENLDYLGGSSPKILEIVFDEVVPIRKTANLEITRGVLFDLDSVVSNERIEIGNFDRQERQFGSFGAAIGSTCCDPGRPIGTEQKITLAQGNSDQQESKNAQDKRVESDGVFPRPVPYYRQSLPKGFGWLMMIAAGIGGGIGGCYVGLLIWLAKHSDNASAKRKAKNYP